jgi:integrase
MLQITAPGSFSAKFKNPPPIKQPSKGEREYLRPSEVEALIKAAKGVGRHGVRDAAMILLMFRHGLLIDTIQRNLHWARVWTLSCTISQISRLSPNTRSDRFYCPSIR